MKIAMGHWLYEANEQAAEIARIERFSRAWAHCVVAKNTFATFSGAPTLS